MSFRFVKMPKRANRCISGLWGKSRENLVIYSYHRRFYTFLTFAAFRNQSPLITMFIFKNKTMHLQQLKAIQSSKLAL